MQGFEAAIAAGVDMIELDVHQLLDGRLVVRHDDTIDGQPLAGISIHRLHELAMKSGLLVPGLGEVLDLCAGRIRLDLELKNSCAPEVLQALRASRFRVDEILLTSFDTRILGELRANSPGLRTGFLTQNGNPDRNLASIHAIGADYLVVHAAALTSRMVRLCERASVPVITWTVNDPEDLRKHLSTPCVACVITDKPREALEIRRSLRPNMLLGLT